MSQSAIDCTASDIKSNKNNAPTIIIQLEGMALNAPALTSLS